MKESGFDIGGLIQVECGMDESLDTVCKLMGEVPPWAKGLELRADGYETMFYKKNRKEYNVHLENQQACDKLNKEYMLRGDLIMASNRKKKQFPLVDKNSCIIYLYKIISSCEICMDTFKKYNLQTEHELKRE